MAKFRGTTRDAAMQFMGDSRMDRRGQSNPNRQRQPKRLGRAGSIMAAMKRMIGMQLKGPDQGMG